MAKKQKSPETKKKETRRRRNKKQIIYTTIRLSRCAAGKKASLIKNEPSVGGTVLYLIIVSVLKFIGEKTYCYHKILEAANLICAFLTSTVGSYSPAQKS